MRGQHERRTGRHVVDVVDEDHALLAETVDDEPVVHDLVVAVHGRLEDPNHPRQRLDRHLDAGAEAPRFGEQDLLYGHGTRVMRPTPYPGLMPAARVDAVAPGSPAARAGVIVGDEVLAVNGEAVRDVIAYQIQVDGAHVELDLRRGGLERVVQVDKAEGAPLGVELTSAVFDRVRTCDNHCPFCFIHQLPKGMRKSLYLKDDDYRLSFLYGNFTTLTRFTEADLERVVSERLGPLYVSIHATDPDVRTRLLRNRRGATSLRWLELLLDAGIEVHGQVVVCPGINDGAVLDDTLLGVLDRFPGLATVGVVPLGVSAHNREEEMREHTLAEAQAVVDIVERWQARFLAALGRRLVYVSDEYYLLARAAVPAARRVRRLPAARERHRHGAHVRGRGARRARGRRRRRHRPALRLLRLGRRRPRRRLPRPPHRSQSADAGPRRAARRGLERRRDGGDGRGGARAAARRAARARAAAAGEERVLRRQHRRHRSADRRRHRGRARRVSPSTTVTCCPTSRCRAAASSTAPRPRSCRAPSRSSRPTARALVQALRRSAPIPVAAS